MTPSIEKLESSLFDWLSWRGGALQQVLSVPCRYQAITSDWGKKILREHAVGFCDGECAPCRPKPGQKAVMFFKDGEHFWCHLRNEEFEAVFGPAT
jgi:hypothetical protein